MLSFTQALTPQLRDKDGIDMTKPFRYFALLLLVHSLLLTSCTLEDLVDPDKEEVFWEQINGPQIESCEGFLVDENGELLAAFFYGGIYRSEDHGESWAPSNDGLGSLSVPCLARGGGDRIYAGTTWGLYISDDNGRHWSWADTVFSMASIRDIAADESGLVIVSAVTHSFRSRSPVDLLLRSLDHGETWTELIPLSSAYAAYISTAGDIFIGTMYDSLWRSDDGGDMWTQVGMDVHFDNIYSITENADGDIFVASGYGIFASGDGGDSWITIAYKDVIGPVRQVTFDSEGALYAAGFRGFYRSTDGGASWDDIRSGMTNAYDLRVCIDPADRIFVGTVKGSIFRSLDDGMSWRQVNETGITSRTLTDLAVTGDGLIIAAAGPEGIYRSTDNARTWQNVEVGPHYNEVFVVAADGEDPLFAGTIGVNYDGRHGGVYRSTDTGMTWEQVGLADRRVTYLCRTPAGEIFAGTTKELFRSPDEGQSWEEIDLREGVTGVHMHILDILATGRGYLFVAASGDIYRSTDNGASWTIPRCMGLPKPASILNLASSRSGDIFATDYYHGIYRSKDNGETWEKVLAVESGVPVPGLDMHTQSLVERNSAAGEDLRSTGIRITSIAIGPDDCLLAGTDTRYIFYSNDYGDSWHPLATITTGSPYAYYGGRSIVFDPDGRILMRTRSAVLRSIFPLQQ
ncbi:MAG: hypothetical protein JSV33_01180 [bacterium]|nr:MAG: hypothetical protein JSV33_01180 [bacterium]